MVLNFTLLCQPQSIYTVILEWKIININRFCYNLSSHHSLYFLHFLTFLFFWWFVLRKVRLLQLSNGCCFCFFWNISCVCHLLQKKELLQAKNTLRNNHCCPIFQSSTEHTTSIANFYLIKVPSSVKIFSCKIQPSLAQIKVRWGFFLALQKVRKMKM